MNFGLVIFICIIFLNYNSAKVLNNINTLMSSTGANNDLKFKRGDPYDYETPDQGYGNYPTTTFGYQNTRTQDQGYGNYPTTTIGYQTTKRYYQTTRPYVMTTVYTYPTTTTTYYYVKPTTQSPY